jgi:hypothetical protein
MVSRQLKFSSFPEDVNAKGAPVLRDREFKSRKAGAPLAGNKVFRERNLPLHEAD